MVLHVCVCVCMCVCMHESLLTKQALLPYLPTFDKGKTESVGVGVYSAHPPKVEVNRCGSVYQVKEKHCSSNGKNQAHRKRLCFT